jgi:hypothetical protein
VKPGTLLKVKRDFEGTGIDLFSRGERIGHVSKNDVIVVVSSLQDVMYEVVTGNGVVGFVLGHHVEVVG